MLGEGEIERKRKMMTSLMMCMDMLANSRTFVAFVFACIYRPECRGDIVDCCEYFFDFI